jgi:predicted CoA-binding protein
MYPGFGDIVMATKKIIPPAPQASQGVSEARIRDIVRNFRRVAVVGMPADLGSAAALDASRLLAYGFQFFPVHSDCGHAFGHDCVPHLHDVKDEVDIVQVLPGSGASMAHLASETIRKRAKVFWVEGAQLDPDIAALLAAEGIQVVAEHHLETEFFRFER